MTSFDELQYFTGLKSIPEKAFYGCNKLASVIIPDGVETIGVFAFYNCPSLNTVTIPATVTSIGDFAFYNCTALEEVNCMIKEPFAIYKNVFLYYDGNQDNFTSAALFVPEGTKAKYQTTNGWREFYTISEEGTGDINGDDDTDVGDIMSVINVMAEKP